MIIDEQHKHYMHRCLQLAANGMGHVAPNPMVGSVIVYNDKIIGEGYHRQYGGPHAEVHAIASVADQHLLQHSTLYVNLEPCAHFGKTPPCADLIIEKKIPRVVIGSVDTFSKVAGKGIERMRNAGIEVTVAILEKESRWLNRRFFTFHEKKRPYIILKWAQTRDGFVDVIRQATPARPTWITNDECRMLVHKWRSEEMGILVGTNTALLDNPMLNLRSWSGKAPIRIVIDRNMRLPQHLHVFDKSQPTLVFTSCYNNTEDNLRFIQLEGQQCQAGSILDACYQENIQSILIEGGSQTLQRFIDAQLWDEVRRFTGDVYFLNGIAAPKLPFIPCYEEQVGNSLLEIGYKESN